MLDNPRNRRDAAVFLTSILGVKVSIGSLEQLASRGTGPAYAMVLGKAVYDEAELRRWAAAQIHKPKIARKARKSLTGKRRAGGGATTGAKNLAAQSADGGP